MARLPEYESSTPDTPLCATFPTTSDESTSQPEEPEKPNVQEEKEPFDWAGSWVWESAAAVLGMTCIGLLIGFLAYVDGSAYASWRYTISPNAVISIIITTAKAAMLVLVPSCLSQLKWNQYQSPTPLYHLQLLDQASRGPWGAFQILWRVAPGLATMGALLMILSVAVDSFAQQLLAFPSQSVHLKNETALIQATHDYGSGWINSTGKLFTVQAAMEPSMQAAILDGLTQKNTPLEPRCPSRDCKYPGFATLGVCSKCEDITHQTKQFCVNEIDEFYSGSIGLDCTYTTPNGFQFSPKDQNAPHIEVLDLAVLSRVPWTSIVNESSLMHVMGIEDPLVSFFAAKYTGQTIYTRENFTAPEEKPTMSECVVYLCERQYAPSHYTTSTQQLQLTRTRQLKRGDFDRYTSLDPLLPSDKNEKLPAYAIDHYVNMDLHNTLKSLFNATSEMDSDSWDVQMSKILYNQPDLGKAMDSMATSMTDVMRADPESFTINGKAFQNETYVHVRWPWIILPLMAVVLSILLLIATAIASRRLRVRLWKSSVLPLLISRLQIDPEHGLDSLQNMDEVLRVSKRVNVVAETGKGSPLLLSEDAGR